MNKVTILLAWGALGLTLLFAQDRRGVAPCSHGTRGQSRPLDLDEVSKIYKEMERAFSRAVKTHEVHPADVNLRFESEVKRSTDAPRRVVRLEHPIPKNLVNSEILIGDLEDLKEFRGAPSRILLLARIKCLDELHAAQAALGPIGLATPEVVKFFGLTTYPVRINFKDVQHAVVDPLK
jgi:hypothetical protein